MPPFTASSKSTAPPPSVDVPEGETIFYVICTSSNVQEDLWHFADFLAISRAFKDTGNVKGHFISLFPHNDWFAKMKKDRICWGYKGPNSDMPILEFKKGTTPWWTYMNPNETVNAPSRLLERLKMYATTLRWPDTLNLIIIGHGISGSGNISVAKDQLKLSDIDAVISTFDYVVQVNVILNSCWSGILKDKFANRDQGCRTIQTSASALVKSWSNSRVGPSGQYRGSPFISAYAASYLKGWESEQKKTGKLTLHEHFESVSLHGKSFGHGGQSATPEHWSSVNLQSAVLDVLYRDYHVVQRKNGRNHLHRVFTPPPPGPQSHPDENFNPAAGSDVFLQCLHQELDGVGSFSPPDNHDHGFATSLWVVEHDSSREREKECMQEIMDGLRWRFQVQERFLFAMEELMRLEFIKQEALEKPIDFDERDLNVCSVADALACFDFGAECTLRSDGMPKLMDSLRGRFEPPLHWLATLIIRSEPSSQIIQILKFLSAKPLLGHVNQGFVDDLEECDIYDNRHACQCDPGKKDPQLGFYLPHGVDLQVWAKDMRSRYHRVKTTYEVVFGNNTWGDDTDMQAFMEDYEAEKLSDLMGPRLRPWKA